MRLALHERARPFGESGELAPGSSKLPEDDTVRFVLLYIFMVDLTGR